METSSRHRIAAYHIRKGNEAGRLALLGAKFDDATKEIWLEKQLLRNLILDSGWMSEPDLDSAIADGKNLPENIRQVADHFASSDQLLAEVGIGDWLADFDKKYPRSARND